MKRFAVLALAVVMVLSFAACGQRARNTEVVENNEVTVETPNLDNAGAVVVTNGDNAGNAGVSNPVVQPSPYTTAFPVPTMTETPAATPTADPTAPTPTPTPGTNTTTNNNSYVDPNAGLQSYNATATQAELNGATTGYVGGDGVNLRQGPGTNYKIISSYPLGKQLSILGSNGGWTKVMIDGNVGYMSHNYVSGTRPAGTNDNSNAVIIVDDPTPTATTVTPSPTVTPTETPSEVIIIG